MPVRPCRREFIRDKDRIAAEAAPTGKTADRWSECFGDSAAGVNVGLRRTRAQADLR